MIIQEIENSFLLTEIEKKYFIKNIDFKSENYIKWLLKILQNEKLFMISLLKEYKNRDIEIWIIKWELMSGNMKKIQELELNENETFDLEVALENI